MTRREMLKERIRRKLNELRRRRFYEEDEDLGEDLDDVAGEEYVDEVEGTDEVALKNRVLDILDKYADTISEEDRSEIESILDDLSGGAVADVEDDVLDEEMPEEEPISERIRRMRRLRERRRTRGATIRLTEAEKRRIKRRIEEALRRIKSRRLRRF